MGQNEKSTSNTFPWKEVLGFLGVVLAAYIGYLGIRSQIEIPIRATQTAEAKMTQASITNAPTLLPTVNSILLTPTDDNSINNDLSVRLPTDSEMSAGVPPNILLENSVNIGLMTKPKTSVFYGKAEKSKEYQLPFFWCAKSPSILNQNLSFLSIEFFVNEKIIPNEYIGALNYEPNKNWDCVSYAVALSGWQENLQYVLEMKISLLQNLNDGESDYLAGDYIYRITIDVP